MIFPEDEHGIPGALKTRPTSAQGLVQQKFAAFAAVKVVMFSSYGNLNAERNSRVFRSALSSGMFR